jgi:arsenite methyltransferase
MTTNTQPDYGLDAPALCRFFFIGGGVALAAAIALNIGLGPGIVRVIFTVIASLAGAYLIVMGSLMVVWSRVIKVRERSALLDRFGWRGDENVLDIGCGRGLLLIGSALRLTAGKATGLDIWSNTDQSANSPAATLANAKRAGVIERVEIVTGDMRALPFGDAGFDTVMSHWVIHNLAHAVDRYASLAEMKRVLKPGGRLLIADIENRAAYISALADMGMTQISVDVRPWRDTVLGLISFGSFRPSAIFATKPD